MSFDKRFEQRRQEMDRRFNSYRRTAVIIGLFWYGVGLSLIGFLVWVCIRILMHFGII